MDRSRGFFFLQFSFFLGSLLASTAYGQNVQLRYEGRIQGPTVTAGSMINQTFAVDIRRPDGCGGNLITTWNSGATVTLEDGAFTLKPTFTETQFANIMNPQNPLGATCPPSSARIMRITWNSETFDVALSDAPKATFSTLAATSFNTRALGGINLADPLSCTAGSVLKFSSGANQLECSPLVQNEIPALAPAQIPSFSGDITGTISAAVVSKIRGVAVSSSAPTSNQVLKYNGTEWAPAADDGGAAVGDATYTSKGVVQVNSSGGLEVSTGLLQMANTGVNPGAYGTASSVPSITVNSQGRITSASSSAVNDSSKLPLSGGTLSGALNMGLNSLSNASSLSSLQFNAPASSAPAVSTAGTGRIYFDSASNKFRVSQNGGTYVDLVPSGGVTSLDGLSDAIGDWDGTPNLAIGPNAGINMISSSSQNIALGSSALESTTNGNKNIAIGHTSLISNSSGWENIAIGEGALMASTTGGGNTALGVGALTQITGSNNTAIGYSAASSQLSGNNNIAIGYNTTLPSTTGSNQLNIGNLIFGNLSSGTRQLGINTIPSSTLDVNGTFTMRAATAAPSAAPSTQGRIYFDSTDNKFKVSENGGAFKDLIKSDSKVCVNSNCRYFIPGYPTTTTSLVVDYSNGDHHLLSSNCNSSTLNIINMDMGSKVTVVFVSGSTNICASFQLDGTTAIVKWKNSTAPASATGYWKYEFIRVNTNLLLGEYSYYN